MRYAIILSYDGSAFCGWQRQDNAPSVQEALETALGTLLGGPVGVVGAGRTDTGVNARHYVAHFDHPSVECDKLAYKLNCILPREVAVERVQPVPDDFHARFSATSRRYRYYIHSKKDPFSDAYSWFCRYSLDVARMNEACKLLLGEHDFSCFEKTGSDNSTGICTVTAAFWEEQEGGRLVFTVEANRFLRNMVRAIVGTMVDIGRGRNEASYINRLLAGGTRSDAGQSVPGHALFLDKVSYGDLPLGKK